ncbi:MAG: signal peptidase II [Limnobacter sp.]|uniref:signal peptidase II n=1 Tax=Limnobacter sp. TaxID=2003368 RepID=UPI0022C2B2E0|nr:signal peptidase II [Limnobacter sp.]MCZ8014150.1 signal peptidase II [Limnobacter sp.]
MSNKQTKKGASAPAQKAANHSGNNEPVVKKSILPWIGFSLLIIVLDQITKLWVQAKLDLGSVIEVTSYFNLVYVLNPGAAFSFLADQEGWQKHFLSAVAVVASIVIVFMMRSSSHRKFAMFCLACILGGALGNLIDRLAHGAVIDFLDFYIQNYHWPAFNVADVAISIGAVGLIVDELFFNKENKSPPAKKA